MPFRHILHKRVDLIKNDKDDFMWESGLQCTGFQACTLVYKALQWYLHDRKSFLRKSVVSRLDTLPVFYAARIFIILSNRTHHWPMFKHYRPRFLTWTIAFPLNHTSHKHTPKCKAFQVSFLGIKGAVKTSRQISMR